MGRYVLGIDQSTQGTKALLFDGEGKLLCRSDLPHEQIVDGHGWVEHDLDEIYKNTIQVVKNLVEKAGIDKADIAVLGISNQRETAACWEKGSGRPERGMGHTWCRLFQAWGRPTGIPGQRP